MDAHEIYPPKYMAARDLKGKDLTLTLRSITEEPLRNQKGDIELKPIISFEETARRAEKTGRPERRFVANKTNWQQIKAAFLPVLGSEVNDWAGQKLTLFPTTTSVAGKTVDCIRLRDITVNEPKKETA